MAFDSTDRKEIILKIDDRSNDGNIPVSAAATTASDGGKIWRESSYDFWKDNEKINRNWKKENVNMNGTGSSGSTSNRESEGFDFMQNEQAAMEDPTSKLIGQFLHKQKASGEISLDMDLEMDELQQKPPHHGSSLPTVAESPSPSAAAVPSVSFENNPVRRRQSKGSPSPAKDEIRDSRESDGVVKCSSSSSLKRSEGGSFQRKSSLLATKPKSRLMDLPTPEKGEPKSAKAGVGKSGQIMRSGFLGKSMEEEEDDPLLEEDLPDEYKKDKLSVLVLLEWLSLILIIAALVCSLTIPYLREKRLWNLMLWKWEVLVLVLICGRLVSGWIIKIIVFFIERNFLLRKRVLYFVYGVRKAVQNCLWLGLVLIAWHYLFDKKVQRETKSEFLRYVTKVLVCLVVGVMLWLVKTLLVKVLASSFHVSAYFDRIQDSLFNQYVIETLSGPPLIEIQRAEEEEERIADEVINLQKAGATIPPGLKTSTLSSPPLREADGSGRIQKSPRGKSPMVSRVLSSEKGEKDDKGITIDHLHKLNPKNVSAWNMKRLMNIIRHGALSTLDEQIQDSTHEDESATQIRSEYEAKVAARKIFQNVAKPGSKYIYLEDIERFLQEDEALKTMSLFEGASESRRISKKALKNWVVHAFRERRALALTLNDTKTAVNRLHKMVNVLVGIIIVVIWLLILGIATSKVLVLLASQTASNCIHIWETPAQTPCEIDGVQDGSGGNEHLTTVSLKIMDKPEDSIIPKQCPGTKAVNRLLSLALIWEMQLILYIEHKSDHWYPAPMIIFKELEELNRVRIAIWLTHRMNHQDMGERWARRALLVEEMVKIFNDLDIKYRLYPIDINVCSMPPVTSDRLPPSWTGPAS
ncbi:LOW QUALITY PROTEIN: mechanosensitive ion channel protein 6-like [Durio zibethinus]|uniref:Mechanosensitive ion channel protein n=1 Tax=Durio zibethinus TaxID=66656 RepID=A0A6P5WP69_DURZI|nr:LOW QUALITY PROTEIN: mechanosensitive ion channel protein 6-like [Durio zibethinus]